jgi:glycosyltransferase involved in cell wall biosynthesis
MSTMATPALVEPTAAERADSLRKGGHVRRVRVLHVVNGEHYAGAERVQDLLAGQLPHFQFEVGLACLKPDRFPKTRRSRDAALYELPMRGRFDLRVVARLVRIVHKQGYRLLHAHTPRSLLVAGLASLITGVPLVYHVHSPTLRDSTHRWRNRINALVERLGMRLVSAVIAVSKSLKGSIRRRGLARRPVFVVRNGVPSGQPKSHRPCGKREWTLGTVALFRPRKGIEVLLEALAMLRLQGLRVRLRAVGGFETPDYERKLQGLCERLGLADAVDWTGFTQDVQGQLARLDLFVLPSLFGEGLPMVILEAMAAGVPVVATRVEGVPEAIRDGQDGLIAEPGDAGSLARVIARVVRGDVEWSRLSASARKRHARKFSDRRMAAGVAAVYRRVLSGK